MPSAPPARPGPPTGAPVVPIVSPPDEFLTVYEVADALKIHPGTIWRQLNDGTFPCPAQKLGRLWRFRRADFDRTFGAPES